MCCGHGRGANPARTWEEVKAAAWAAGMEVAWEVGCRTRHAMALITLVSADPQKLALTCVSRAAALLQWEQLPGVLASSGTHLGGGEGGG